jgi:sulfur carrier protein
MTSDQQNYHLNDQPQALLKPFTVAELIEQQQMTGKRVLVVINDEVISKSNWSDTMIEAGDKVDIMSPITGG